MSGVLTELRQRVSMSSADWSRSKSDAWIYGVIVGWDLKPDDDPEHDESAMPTIAARFNLTDEQVAELRRLHVEFDTLIQQEEAAQPQRSSTEAPDVGTEPAAVFIVTLTESTDPGRLIVTAEDAEDSAYRAMQIVAAATPQFMPWDFTAERMTWDEYIASGGPENPNYVPIRPIRKQAQQ